MVYLVFFFQQSEIRVDEIQVVLGRHIVISSQLLLEEFGELADRLMHVHNVTHDCFSVLLRNQSVLQRRTFSETHAPAVQIHMSHYCLMFDFKTYIR